MPNQSPERHARWALIGIAAVIVAVAAAVGVIMAHEVTTPKALVHRASPTTTRTPQVIDGWNVQAENALAARPMPVFAPQAALPHVLTSRTAGPPITLPAALSASASGALAQLKALDGTGLMGGDPDVYAQVYRQLSLPDAPNPRTTGLWSLLTSFRASGDLPDTGPAPNLTVNYQVTEGLIKGTADDGRYAVVCVLGELAVQTETQAVAAGVGDCQAMRWTGSGWRISPGDLAAAAPCAWPGTTESVEAGYRELS